MGTAGLCCFPAKGVGVAVQEQANWQMRGLDVLAGLSVAGLLVAGLLVPGAVAYAGIAGLAPARALIAGVVGGLVYAMVGRSRFAVVSATSSSASILAAALDSMAIAPQAAVAIGAGALAQWVIGAGRAGGICRRPEHYRLPADPGARA
jgi:MFS superfamily sulfate permease-like transporter